MTRLAQGGAPPDSDPFDLPGTLEDPQVSSDLTRKKNGLPEATASNVLRVLRGDPRWRGRLKYSVLDHSVMVDERPLTDDDLTGLHLWLDETYTLRVGEGILMRAARYVARRSQYHPIARWLAGLVWDGVPRIDTFLSRYLRAEDNELNRALGRAFLISVVARAVKPGAKVDTVLILVGPQGSGKSQACAALVPDPAWHSDTGIDIGRKDAFVNLSGKWIYEVAEMESLGRVTNEAAKQFVTSCVDRYRAPYERRAEDHPRTVVFVATTNLDEFLRDPSGARRYWPVRVGIADLAGIVEDRDQFFAEAHARYVQGVPWILPPEYRALLVAAQREYQVAEPWAVALAPWVKKQEGRFTVEDAMRDGLEIAPKQWTIRGRQQAGQALAQLGCRKVRLRDRSNGRVWAWEHVEEA